jgi:hypothetical protein
VHERFIKVVDFDKNTGSDVSGQIEVLRRVWLRTILVQRAGIR